MEQIAQVREVSNEGERKVRSAHFMVEASIDDPQLLRRLRKGDERAFAILYERYQGPIFRFALHMSGSQAVAEDVTQEVFMVLISKPGAYEPEKGPLAAYLFGIARNLARRADRNGSPDIVLDDVEDPRYAIDDDPIDKLTGAEALESLRKALLALPELYREVVVLCDLEEMSYEQAAGMLDCSPGTVASRLHRAHKLLKSKLSRVRAKAV
jgi:RNA polymerase sigma-70 factor (ECF subfamily)